jgi:hypothetical protein
MILDFVFQNLINKKITKFYRIAIEFPSLKFLLKNVGRKKDSPNIRYIIPDINLLNPKTMETLAMTNCGEYWKSQKTMIAST